jgi:hypothetical protein
MFQSPRYHHSPLPKRITKSVLWRAVDVNRPVTLWCVPVAVLATRARNVTGGLTSPARLVTVGRIQGMKSGVLHTVSPSQPRSPECSPVFSQESRELQRHWAEAPGCDFAPKVHALPRAFAVVFATPFARGLPSGGWKCERMGGSPRLRFRTEGAHAVEGRLRLRLQRPLPADCRPAAQGLWQQTQIREQVIDQ